MRAAKRALRRQLRAAWAALPPDRAAAADAAIAQRLSALPEVRAAGSIFCYASTPGEIDTRALLEQALRQGKRVAVPLITGAGVMEARLLTSLDQLRPGAFDLPEPADCAPALPAEEIDLCILPCLSCGWDGSRLGKGGGYYDRFLAGRRFFAVALCYEELLHQDIPMAPHDAAVDAVVTELAVYRRANTD